MIGKLLHHLQRTATARAGIRQEGPHQEGPILFMRQLENAKAEVTLKGCLEHLSIARELFEKVPDPENYDPSCLRGMLISKALEQFPLHTKLPSEHAPLHKAVEEALNPYVRYFAQFWITPRHLKRDILRKRKEEYVGGIEKVIMALQNSDISQQPRKVIRAVHNFEWILAAHNYDFGLPGRFRAHPTGVIEITGVPQEEEKELLNNTRDATDIIYKMATKNIVHYLQHQKPLKRATNTFLETYDGIKSALQTYAEKGNVDGMENFLRDYEAMRQQELTLVIRDIRAEEERRYKELLAASQSAIQENAKDLWQDAAKAYTTFVREYSRVLEETEADIEETVEKCRSILERNLLKESNMEAYAVG